MESETLLLFLKSISIYKNRFPPGLRTEVALSSCRRPTSSGIQDTTGSPNSPRKIWKTTCQRYYSFCCSCSSSKKNLAHFGTTLPNKRNSQHGGRKYSILEHVVPGVTSPRPRKGTTYQHMTEDNESFKGYVCSKNFCFHYGLMCVESR